MATVNGPSPGLYAAVLHTLRSADPGEASAAGALAAFVPALTADEAVALPAALAGVLPLLRSDPERLRFAAELAVRLDLWEMAADLVRVAAERADPDLVLAAAALCGSAGCDASLADELLGALPSGTELVRAAEIRLRPDARVRTPEERALHLQRWPGARRPGERAPLAPVVVLDPTLEPARMLGLAVELLRVGAAVRRLPAPPVPVPAWFGPDTVLVCGRQTRTRVLSAFPGFAESHIIVSPALADDRDVGALLRRVDGLLPPARRLRLAELPTELATSVWDPEVYGLGVYGTGEASYLTTAPVPTLYRLARRGLLEPRRYGTYVWAFRDLVAVRTWRYLTSRSTRPIPAAIVPRLAGFSGDATVVRLGATSDGHVLADRGSGWEDVVSGARVLDLPVEDVDDAFRPFSLGDRRAPDLLAASPNTRLHPAVLHGAPYRRGHRITAAALATLERRNGAAAITAAYPELDGVEVTDTVEVGRALLAAG